MSKVLSYIKTTFSGILKSLYNAVKRYPAAIALAAAAGVLLIISIHIDSQLIDDQLARWAISLIVMLPVALCLGSYYESKNNLPSIYKYSAIVLPILLVVLYYKYYSIDFHYNGFAMRSAGIFIAFSVLFSVITFLGKREYPQVYARKLCWRLLISLLYTGIIIGGISAIILALDKLLGIKIIDELYQDVTIVIPSFFLPAFFFSGVPAANERMDTQLHSLYKILLVYVLMPILSAYTIVLYAYFIKLLVELNFPSNMVATLVLWYSLVGVTVLYQAFSLKDDSKWTRIFFKIYPFALIAPVLMMIASLIIRIANYGITESRYFGLAAGVWIFIICILMLNQKRSKDRLKIIPLALVIIGLISIIGPISAFSISIASQNKQFEKTLIANDMLQNGKIQQNPSMSDEDKVKTTSIVRYFENRHGLNRLNYWPQTGEELDIQQVLGFETYPVKFNSGDNIYLYQIEMDNAMNISGYDYYIRYMRANNPYKIENHGKQYALNYTIVESDTDIIGTLSITDDIGKIIYKKDVSEIADVFLDDKTESMELSSDQLTYIDENETVKLKYIIDSVEQMNDNGDIEKSISFSLLIGIK